MKPVGKKPGGPFCHVCKSPIIGARVIIGARWTCPSCAYRLEYGDAPTVSSPLRRRRVHPQEERLFPLPPAIPKKRRHTPNDTQTAGPTRPDSEPRSEDGSA
jgi:hypothetical protein